MEYFEKEDGIFTKLFETLISAKDVPLSEALLEDESLAKVYHICACLWLPTVSRRGREGGREVLSQVVGGKPQASPTSATVDNAESNSFFYRTVEEWTVSFKLEEPFVAITECLYSGSNHKWCGHFSTAHACTLA